MCASCGSSCSRGTAMSWQLPGGLRAALARPAAALCPTTSSSSLSSWMSATGRVQTACCRPLLLPLHVCSAHNLCVCAHIPLRFFSASTGAAGALKRCQIQKWPSDALSESPLPCELLTASCVVHTLWTMLVCNHVCSVHSVRQVAHDWHTLNESTD